MNPLILEELKKCRVASIPEISTGDLVINIPKGNGGGAKHSLQDLVVNSSYEIKVEDYIVNPPENFNLAENWNNGTSPTRHIMEVVVLQLMGKMVKIKSSDWEGWIPRKSMKVMRYLQ